MKKPVLATAPIAMLALMLAACGSKPEPAPQEGAADAAAEAADAAVDAAGESIDSADDTMAAEGEMAAPAEAAPAQ